MFSLLIALGLLLMLAVRFLREVPDVRHKQGCNRGALGTMRSALSVYYGDMAGRYPDQLDSLLKDRKYLDSIPDIWVCPDQNLHPATHEVVLRSSLVPQDSGKIGYVNGPGGPDRGAVFIDCTHTDSKGTAWAAY
ncbi:MAG: hypothetical protein WC881_03465 [Elusimicrobiota bacterium]